MIDNPKVLERLAEYCKYLYEEESEITAHLNRVAKIYFSFAVLSISGGVAIIKVTYGNEFLTLAGASSFLCALISITYLLSFALMILSFILTTFVSKVFRYERLCQAKSFVLRASYDSDYSGLLVAIIADYAVAADRNHIQNQRKANYLRNAFRAYIAGILLFCIGLLSSQFCG